MRAAAFVERMRSCFCSRRDGGGQGAGCAFPARPAFRSWACRWLADAASLRRRPPFRLFSAFAYAASGYCGYAGLRKRNRSVRAGVATMNTTAERANISMEIFVAIYLLFGPLIGWTACDALLRAIEFCPRLSGWIGSQKREEASFAGSGAEGRPFFSRQGAEPAASRHASQRSIGRKAVGFGRWLLYGNAAMAALLQNLRNRSEYAKSPGASDGCAGTPLCFPFIFQPHPAAWKKSPFCRLLYDCPAPRQTAPADASAHRSASSARRWSP